MNGGKIAQLVLSLNIYNVKLLRFFGCAIFALNLLGLIVEFLTLGRGENLLAIYLIFYELILTVVYTIIWFIAAYRNNDILSDALSSTFLIVTYTEFGFSIGFELISLYPEIFSGLLTALVVANLNL